MLFVVYLAIGGRESQSEPAVRMLARAYMDCNYLKIDCLFLQVMNMHAETVEGAGMSHNTPG